MTLRTGRSFGCLFGVTCLSLIVVGNSEKLLKDPTVRLQLMSRKTLSGKMFV